MPEHPVDRWPSGARDTTEFPKVSLEWDVSLRRHLNGFLALDGVGAGDYEAQRTLGNLPGTDSRLRTYRKMYEKLGLVYRKENRLHLSRLGRQLAALEEELEAKKEAVLSGPRATAIDILSRYQLKNPVDRDPLPDDCDILPCIVIWKAMIRLDGKMHHEEMNRVILRVMRMADLDAAIGHIRTARAQYGSYSGVPSEELDGALGQRVHSDQDTARIAPWFSFAGWGGLIIEQTCDPDGFRHLVQTSIPMLERVLAHPPQYYEAADEEDWWAYYIGDGAMEEECPHPEPEEPAGREEPSHSPRGDQPWPLNQILFGAPGTGKTYSTVGRAVAIVEKRPAVERQYTHSERRELMRKYQDFVAQGLIYFVTFHQSYGYEDFVQGIRPDLSNPAISFKPVDGIFKLAADRAYRHPRDNHVIIIDEINRANISKVFGELITLVEADKRWGELNQLSVTLPMGDTFSVPNNLYLIGTMNSADKSISLLDSALRRRFSFVEMPPREDYVPDPVLRSVMHSLNGYLKGELRGTDLLIGHAYFIHKTGADLAEIMNENVIPLLYEYFYDDEAKVKRALECLRDTDYRPVSRPFGRVFVQKKDSDDERL